MTFLILSQLSESVFYLNFPVKHFLETKPNFSLTEKYFLLTNFSNGKQTQKILKNNFLKSKFREINIT